MSDTINTITVVLDQETRDDDCEAILTAIRMVKGVMRAQPNISDHTEYMAQERAKHELGKKLLAVIYSKT